MQQSQVVEPDVWLVWVECLMCGFGVLTVMAVSDVL